MKYKLLKKEKVFQNYFVNVEKVSLEIDSYDGEKMQLERIAFLKRGFCAILLEIKETNEIVLVEQFRYSAIEKENGWIQEIVAGILEEGEDPYECAIRETKEETGFLLKNLEKIGSFYPSPGISNQVMHLFFSRVSKKERIQDYKKLWDKEEDLKVCYYNKKDIPHLLKNKIVDGKTVIALQWYLLNKNQN